MDSKGDLTKSLLEKQLQIKEQLQTLESEDPLLLTIPVSSESGDESWEADTHIKSLAIKNHLLTLSTQIQETLQRLQKGSYGTCTKCAKHIEADRLKIMPTAALCLTCMAKR